MGESLGLGRFRFVVNEVFQGVARNLTMTFAVIVTFAVTLSLLGVGLLVGAQVNQMKDYWYDKVEVSVFLCTADADSLNCTPGGLSNKQRVDIKEKLQSLEGVVESIYFETQAEAYERFREQFASSPIARTASIDQLPASFRVKLADPESYQLVTEAVQDMPGVDVVRDQRDTLDRLFVALSGLQVVALGFAATMLVVTVMLVSNTMRLAAFARRREVGIMRLVGASKFSIRLPFLIEALVAALVGGVLATGALVAIKIWLVDGVLAQSFSFTPFFGWNVVWLAGGVVALVGVTLSMVTATFSLRRYLKV
jgi:cell division transport system permease protein